VGELRIRAGDGFGRGAIADGADADDADALKKFSTDLRMIEHVFECHGRLDP
jgi:hypothetical protein